MDIARGLNISTIANGVETASELSTLKQLKCHSMQGYLFSPALAAQDFETLLWESSTKHAQPLVKPVKLKGKTPAQSPHKNHILGSILINVHQGNTQV